MDIPYFDLKQQYAGIRDEIQEAMQSVLDNCQYVLGPAVKDFESAFANYCGVSHCAGVNSGTSALHLALLAAGVGPGDEVITVPFTFVATVAAIRYTGATPVFVDIEPETYTMDTAGLEAVITERTRAILPVHLYGHPADMQPILEIASRHKLKVIEDAAQAHGASYQGRPVGGLGDAGCFSFYPGKNLGAYGEGGAVVTRDPETLEQVTMMRDWGMKEKYHHDVMGFNYRMEGLQGAVLGVKLRHLEKWTEARRRLAACYHERLKDGPWPLPVERPGDRHVYHLYVIRIDQREMVMHDLKKQGIQTALHYPVPVHLQKAHADLGYGEGRFPVSEATARTVLSLPLYPEMPDSHVHAVCDALHRLGA